MNVDPSRFHESFFDEVAEHLENLEGLVVAIDGASATRADFDALFRVAHSIKGASGTFGFREMAELTHDLESVLDGVREGKIRVSPQLVDVVLATGDVLRDQLAAYRAQRTPAEKHAVAARVKLQQLLNVGSDAKAFSIRFQTHRESAQAEAAISALTATLRELGECNVIESNAGTFDCIFLGSQLQAEIADLFAFVTIDGDTLSIEATGAATSAVPSAIVEEFGFFDDEPPGTAPIQPAAVAEFAARATDDATVRVKLQKIDTLINLVGELLIAQSSLQDRALRLDANEHADFHASINDLQRHTRDVRESVMSMRMLPIGSIFARFPRMVRELSAQLGKEVVFESSGGDTELDKGLIESIVDPLTHIIRNSVDHGIESAADRVAAGKPANGTVAVRAFQRGGNVVIEIRDDGKGMDRERILAKARENDIRLKENMSDRDVWALVCAPGFSTASTVTDVSGRGVGMDVVKRNIHALGGSVEIDSTHGSGTTIALVLPLTLAILDGLAVRSGDEVCIVPLTSIAESIAISSKDVTRTPDRTPFIMYRGEPLPLIATPGTRLHIDETDRIAVVLVSDGRSAGLLVDSLESEHQVVIKSLEQNFRKVDGFSGATILGSGKVALILDVAALVA